MNFSDLLFFPTLKCKEQIELLESCIEFRKNPQYLKNAETPHCATIAAFWCRQARRRQRHTVGQIPQKCKETSNLMWLSLIWVILILFVSWNLFCRIANLIIKYMTETKNGFVLFYKNLKSSISKWLTHFTLRFLYIFVCSGPKCASLACLAWPWALGCLQFGLPCCLGPGRPG